MTLSEERKAFEEEKRLFAIEKKEFSRKVEMEDRRLEQENNLFQMKFKMLEEELMKLATEKEELEKKKYFYDKVAEFHGNNDNLLIDPQITPGEMFFRGVKDQESLKKRYKELIKIYHPDNADGDNTAVLAINQQYDYLIQIFI